MLSGPATWKFPETKPDRITLSDDDVKTLDEIWKEMNGMTGRRNLGARLFNVSSMLSNLLESADGKTAVLHLANYSGYPVETSRSTCSGSIRRPGSWHPARRSGSSSLTTVKTGRARILQESV